MNVYDGFVNDSFAFVRPKVQRACYRAIELTGEEREFLQSCLISLVSAGVTAPSWTSLSAGRIPVSLFRVPRRVHVELADYGRVLLTT